MAKLSAQKPRPLALAKTRLTAQQQFAAPSRYAACLPAPWWVGTTSRHFIRTRTLRDYVYMRCFRSAQSFRSSVVRSQATTSALTGDVHLRVQHTLKHKSGALALHGTTPPNPPKPARYKNCPLHRVLACAIALPAVPEAPVDPL